MRIAGAQNNLIPGSPHLIPGSPLFFGTFATPCSIPLSILQVTRRWTSVPFSTILPVLFAESMSWSGVLSGNSRFFCAEYVLWMVIASTWAWDAAELLHKSDRWSDQVVRQLRHCFSFGRFLYVSLRYSSSSTRLHVRRV